MIEEYLVQFYQNISYLTWLILSNTAGVAFLKAVPEGTYDVIIVDSSDPIEYLSTIMLLFCFIISSRAS